MEDDFLFHLGDFEVAAVNFNWMIFSFQPFIFQGV